MPRSHHFHRLPNHAFFQVVFFLAALILSDFYQKVVRPYDDNRYGCNGDSLSRDGEPKNRAVSIPSQSHELV